MKRTIESHAREHVAHLLDRLAYQVNRAAKHADEEAIHDLRVAIRRFAQSLRVFRQFFPNAKAKKIRRKLRAVMDAAAEIRNRDIAAALAATAGVPAGAPALQALRTERERRRKALVSAIKAWSRDGVSRKWRNQLEL
jgi:CHAD domain-containing protein